MEAFMLFDTLESRMLMSASPVSQQVTADRLVVQAALAQFKSDCINSTLTLMADCDALKAAGLSSDTTLTPLFKQFHTDAKAMRASLKADNLAEDAAVLQDESVIDEQLLKILGDAGNPTQRKADKAVLVQDQIQLQNDEIAGLNSRLKTRKDDYTTLFNDLSAIVTALGSDTNASPALQAAVTQFTTDRTNSLNTLATDLQTIINDRTTLVSALQAEEGTLT
jgi:hypothetical protein